MLCWRPILSLGAAIGLLLEIVLGSFFFLSFTRSFIFKFAKLKCQCNIGLLSKEYIGFNVPSLVSQAQQGEVSVITSLGDPLYKLELSSLVPYSGLVSI